MIDNRVIDIDIIEKIKLEIENQEKSISVAENIIREKYDFDNEKCLLHIIAHATTAIVTLKWVLNNISYKENKTD